MGWGGGGGGGKMAIINPAHSYIHEGVVTASNNPIIDRIAIFNIVLVAMTIMVQYELIESTSEKERTM